MKEMEKNNRRLLKQINNYKRTKKVKKVKPRMINKKFLKKNLVIEGRIKKNQRLLNDLVKSVPQKRKKFFPIKKEKQGRKVFIRG